MNAVKTKPIVLSDDEAAELYRFTRNSYVSPSAYPALMKLLTRVVLRVEDVRPDVIGPR
jgi:hypothetical protein